jgi:hypothetical protein
MCVTPVGLLRRECVELEHLRKAHDRIQRRAQVMAHTREELVLGLRGARGLLVGLAKGQLRGLHIRDVPGDRVDLLILDKED